MASFTYPQHLLHKTIEPQWFPRSKGESESSLNALEAAEESNAARLESIIETPAAVIGMDNRQSHGQRRTSTDEMDNSQEADTSTVVGGMPAQAPPSRFWNHRQSTDTIQRQS